MRGDGVNIRGHDIGFYFVAVHLRARACVIDRIQHREQLSGPIALAQACEGEDRPGGGVGVLAAVFADARRIAFDIARLERRLIEGRRKEQSEFGLLEDELFVNGRHRAGGAYRVRSAGDDAPRLRDAVDAALDAACRSERRAIVKIAAPVPIAVPTLPFERGFERRRMSKPIRAAGAVPASTRNRNPFHEGRVQDPREPHTLALAALADAIHAVIPVARAHQWQPMFADRQTLIERPRTVLIERGALFSNIGQEVGVVLAGLQGSSFEKLEILIEYRDIAG